MENTKIPSITNFQPLQPISVPVKTVNQPVVEKQTPQIANSDLVSEAKSRPQPIPDKFFNRTQSEILLQALYYVWDAFERSNVPFFLTGQTAEDAMANKDLSGEIVTVGVRRVEWVSGGGRVFRTFMGEPISEDPGRATYRYENVPIYIGIYDDHDCIIGTDSINYRYETFRVPNPYSTFTQLFTR